MSGKHLKGSRRSIDSYCAIYKCIFMGPKKLLKTQNFGKKRQPLQWKKFFGLFLFIIIEYDKRQGKTYKGTQDLLPFTVQVTRSFL